MILDEKTREAIAQLRKETDPYWAYDRRRDYLIQKYAPDTYLSLWSIAHMEIAVKQGSATAIYYWDDKLKFHIKNLIKMVNELYHTRPRQVSKDEITNQNIEAARNYPITDLIEFKRDMAVCFVHADKSPSLHFIKDKNVAWCFSCQKMFDSIDVLMIRDGYTFQEAVRRLMT